MTGNHSSFDPATTYESLTARSDFDWVSVLKRAGAEAFLTGRSGPCPFCGGTDRYAYVYKWGGWRCFRCTDGKITHCSKFLMKFMGYSSFKELADHIRDFYGVGTGNTAVDSTPRPAVPPTPKPRVIDPVKALARIDTIWSAARPVTAGDPVDRYLRFRLPGLKEVPVQIRTHPALEYWDAPLEPGGKPIFVGKFPAMVVLGYDAAGKVVQVHKTYLTSEGSKAAVKNPKKTDIGIGCNSFALRLGEPSGDTLGVSEGIETGLAATLLDGIPVWPCHSSTIMANFVLPEHLCGRVKMMVIYADSDEVKNGKKAGSAAAAVLATRLRKERVRSLIVRPAKVLRDMADLVTNV
jgi:putative DNA primase/helicase